jgi:hypothetical protein
MSVPEFSSDLNSQALILLLPCTSKSACTKLNLKNLLYLLEDIARTTKERKKERRGKERKGKIKKER